MSADTAAENSSPSGNLGLADSYFVDEEYSSALEAYSSALSSIDEAAHDSLSKSLRFRSLSRRAATYLKLLKPAQALEDVNAAIALIDGDGLNLRLGEEEICHMRAGQAAFELGSYSDAKVSFELAAKLAALNGRDEGKYQSWVKKCLDAEPQYSSNVAKSKTPVSAPPAKPASKLDFVNGKQKRPTMPKYQYYQSDTFMTISILEANVKPEDLRVDFGLDKLTVVLSKGGEDFTVICGTLFDAVDVSKCKVKYMDEKVLIKLRKKDKHSWHELFGSGARDESKGEEEEEGKAASNEEETEETKDIPILDRAKPTPYASQRDWNAIERDLKKQEEAEKPEGEEALNKLFQGIYGDASEETKRAMVKSFQTSGGTVLSTNWDEVSKTDYEKERQAPKGMEWKNWEGDKLPQKED